MAIGAFIKDSSAVNDLSDPRSRTIMVIGGSDTGKTTLIKELAGFLSAITRVGVADLDMGQSHIGPPTTLAWGNITGGFTDWKDIPAEDFYFVGTVTPFGSLVPSVVGAKLITDRALSAARKVIIDTTGLITEPAGRILKQSKIDIIRPDIILALERTHELEHILGAFRFNRTPRIYRLPALPQVRSKSLVRRAAHRFKQIKNYLAGSSEIEVPLDKVGVLFADKPFVFSSTRLKNLVVSFRDKRNRDCALGVITGAKPKKNTLLIWTPLESISKSSSIVIGKTELDMINSSLRNRQ